MILHGDYHTHSNLSDGKETLLENAISAKQKGLKEIGVTEHGFNHIYGIKPSDVEKMRDKIDYAIKKTGLNIYLGIEANFTSLDGDIDMSIEQMKDFDYVIVGYHKSTLPKTLRDYFEYKLPNLLNIKSKSLCEKNTQMILKTMDKYPFKILAHMGYCMCCDYMKIARHAKERNILIELNGKRINFSEQIIKQMADEKIKMILNSDAHSPQKVGECNDALNKVMKLNVDKSLLVNVDKLWDIKGY